MNAGQFNHSNTDYLTTSASDGFVPYTEIGNAGGGGGNGWTKIANSGFGFPFAGVWNVPPTTGSLAPYPSLTDWPTRAGDNPNYPNGIIGGHEPNCDFCSGWYAVKYTAATSGPVDLDIKAWQTAIYPNIPPNNNFGGATRPQQVLIQKQVGSTYTDLLRSPLVTRHGITNKTGTPQYTAANAPTPGRPESFATQQDEINAAMRSSAHPNLYRLTNLQMNAGESVIISYAPYQGENHVGFLGFNEVVRTGANRIATTRWDLSDDFSAVGSAATGIGPDSAWSYGILKSGSFMALDHVNVTPEDGTATEINGWGEPLGWFLNSTIGSSTGPFVPGIVKAVDGFNSLNGGVVNGAFTGSPVGDFPGGKVAIHTPTTDVDPAQTSVIRWTAPRNMTVNASGDLWRVTLPDSTDRRHQYTLLKNGVALTNGTVSELGFNCGAGDTNSACAKAFSANNISVVTGDRLELQIAPLQSSGSPPGDYNNNGTVDAGDYAVWRRNPANFGGDPAGYNTWRSNFGNTGGASVSASPSFVGVDFTVTASASGFGTAVPEPAAMALLLIGGAIATCIRRRTNLRPL
jgi:hypothetical protein